MQNFSNNKGNVLITLILCVIFVAVGILVIKVFNSSPKNNPNATQLSDTETVHSWLRNIETIDNIYFDKIHSVSGSITKTKEYILGSTKKIVYLNKDGEVDHSQDTMIEDLKNSTHTFYNELTGRGRRNKFLPSNSSSYIYVDWAYDFSELRNYTYELSTGFLEDTECFIAKSKEDIIYFDKDTKLILKIQDATNSETYMLFSNIVTGSLTDQAFEVPSTVAIEDN